MVVLIPASLPTSAPARGKTRGCSVTVDSALIPRSRERQIGRLPARLRLRARQRLAVYLRYRADLPFEEIAAILGIQAVSARSHVSRALETLRESFADERETNQ